MAPKRFTPKANFIEQSQTKFTITNIFRCARVIKERRDEDAHIGRCILTITHLCTVIFYVVSESTNEKSNIN